MSLPRHVHVTVASRVTVTAEGENRLSRTSTAFVAVGPVESELLQECRACLKLVGMMPDTDARFARYQKLRSKAFGDE